MATAASNEEINLEVRSREAVAVFATHDDLVAAIEELEMAGFDRSQMHLVAGRPAADPAPGRDPANAPPQLDNGQPKPETWVDRHELAEGKTAIAGGLAYIGSIAAVGAVVATGGGLAAAIAAAVAAGGASGAVGAWLGSFLGSSQAEAVAEQAAQGGLLLWVAIRTPEQEGRAREILERRSHRKVELHELTRPWSADQTAAGDWQPDPLLSK